MTENKEPKVKSLYKALKLLECFTVDSPEIGISELSRITGMQKSTVHNIISTFEMSGYIQKDLKSAKYRLGWKVLKLSYIFNSFYDIKQIVIPHLQSISKITENSVFFAAMSEDKIIYIDGVYPSNTPIRSANITGREDPPHCTALGKILLAYSPEETVSILVPDKMEKFTETTITTKKDFIKELQTVKKRGFAVDNMEHEYGIKCVAVPVTGIDGNVQYALSISGPSLKFTRDDIKKYTELLTKTAVVIGRSMS